MMLTLRGGLLVVVVVFKKPLAFFSAKMRVVISFVSPRYSQHIVGLWKKEIQRVSKNKSNSLSGRKVSRGSIGKHCELNRTASVFQFSFEATKNRAIAKTTSIIRHSGFLITKLVVKNTSTNIFLLAAKYNTYLV